MKSRSFKRLFLLLVICPLTLSEVFNVNKELLREMKACREDWIKASNDKLLGKVGEELMNQYESNGLSFVYSELKAMHKLSQLFASASDYARDSVNAYLGLKHYKDCKDLYCKAFSSAIDGIKQRQGGGFSYESFLYKNPHRNLETSFDSCATVKELDFSKGNVLSTLNNEYKAFSEDVDGACLQTYLDSETDFFFLSGLKVPSSLFGSTESFPNEAIPFRDMDDKLHKINWVGFNNPTWVAIVPMSPDNAEVNSRPWYDLYISRTDLNYGNLMVLHFLPKFEGGVSVSAKTKALKYVFSNLKQYIHHAVSKSLPNSMTYRMVVTPIFNTKTDADAKLSLKDKMSNLFNPNQITNLYISSDTVHEMRTWEHYSNKAYATNYEKSGPTGNDIGYMSSPFVFVIMDKESGVVLKTGAFLRPKAN